MLFGELVTDDKKERLQIAQVKWFLNSVMSCWLGVATAPDAAPHPTVMPLSGKVNGSS